MAQGECAAGRCLTRLYAAATSSLPMWETARLGCGVSYLLFLFSLPLVFWVDMNEMS
jgi:hypothetical protein